MQGKMRGIQGKGRTVTLANDGNSGRSDDTGHSINVMIGCKLPGSDLV